MRQRQTGRTYLLIYVAQTDFLYKIYRKTARKHWYRTNQTKNQKKRRETNSQKDRQTDR